MLHADHALARRHERAAMAIESGYALAHAALRPDLDIEVAPIADGLAVYAGVASPMSQATGLGMDGPVGDADLAALEAVYHRRGAPARIVVCPLADGSLIAALGRRGYVPTEFEHVTVRPLDDATESRPPDGVDVRITSRDEAARYAAAVCPNFFEDGKATPDMMELVEVLCRVPYATSVLGRVDGQDAGGGALLIHEGLAMLAGAGTLPQFRNRGVHTAVFAERLRLAREAGCDLAVMGCTPGSISQRNAERKGFRVAYTKVVFAKEPPRGAA